MNKRIGFILLSWLCVTFLLAVLPAHAQSDLTHGRTFYCSWDHALKPDIAAGTESWTGDYTPADGHQANALKITDKPVNYMPNGNFSRDQGTLTLWFKLDAQSKSDRMAIISATNFRFQIYRSKNQVFFMTGTQLPGSDFKWDYSLLLHNRDVPADKWMHLALTWDKQTGDKAVYLNGKLAGKTQTKLFETGPGGQSLRIGEDAPGLYDELNIWSSVLFDEQIQQIYNQHSPAVEKTSNTQSSTWRIEPKLANFNYADSIVAPGQAISINIPFVNNTTLAQEMTAQLQVLDIWEKPVGQPEIITLSLQANEKTTINRSYTMAKLGCYKLRVTDVNTPTLLREVTSFACLPQGTPPDHSFFGAHVNATQYMPEMARRLGFSHNRVHNMTQFTWWVRLEPEPGQWDMKHNNRETYQRYLDLGFTHYGQWFGAPHWAVDLADGTHPTARQPMAYPAGWAPNNEQAIRDYVTQTLHDFPKIKQWEMWNEPYVSMFWQGSPDQYFALCRIMYQQAKSIRPDLEVYAQLPYDSPWLDRVLELGILDYCDGIAYHRYYNATEHPQTVAVPVNKLRARLKTFGKENIPLINSESGVTGTTFLRGLDIPEYSPEQLKIDFKFRQAAGMMVQCNAVLMSLGVKARYHYFHQPVNIQKGRAYPNYTTCDITRSPIPMAVSNAIMVWQLDGGTFKQSLNPVDGLRVYLFERKDGKTLAIAWCEDTAQISLSQPTGQMLDMMGNPLENKGKMSIAQEPVYLIVDQPVAAVAQMFAREQLTTLVAPKVEISDQDNHGVAPLPPMPDFQVATEMGPSRLHPVDLGQFVNMSLADPIQGDGKGGWTDEGPNNDARMMTPGRHTWFGVPFVMPGKSNIDPSVITMHGMTFQNGPQNVGPIPVNLAKVRGLFFAHAANWMSGKITENPVRYTINYQDGSQVQLPMRGGREINNWWFTPDENEDARSVQFIHPDPITRKSPARYLRVSYWENPKTSVPITSITIQTVDPKMTYVLCGITAAQW